MARVMIKCPKTGRAVPTGFDMSKSAFDSSTLTNNTSSCPACGGAHTWSKRDSWLEGEGK